MSVVPGTRWPQVLRRCAGELHRELRVTVSPIVKPQKWIFVAGCYNSGTTLLRTILGQHRRISALPAEGQYLTDQLPIDHELGLSRMWVEREDLYRLDEESTGPDPVRIAREWGSRLDRAKPVFLDQTPAHAARTRWLQRHFAPAYFVVMVRNGYAVAEGIRRKARPVHRQNGWPLDMAAHQWGRSNEILLEDAAHLQNILWVRYEDFVAGPHEEMQRIYNFLQLPAEEGPDLEAEWSVHEKDNPIANFNEESMSRLTAEEILTISRSAGNMLQHFGYELLLPGADESLHDRGRAPGAKHDPL